MDIKHQLQVLFDTAINSKEGLKKLKEAAIANQQYELAAELRQIEKNNFPEQPHEIEAKQAESIFAMVGIAAGSQKEAWLAYQAVTAYNMNNKQLTIKEAVKIKDEAKELFSKWQYTEKGKE